MASAEEAKLTRGERGGGKELLLLVLFKRRPARTRDGKGDKFLVLLFDLKLFFPSIFKGEGDEEAAANVCHMNFSFIISLLRRPSASPLCVCNAQQQQQPKIKTLIEEEGKQSSQLAYLLILASRIKLNTRISFYRSLTHTNTQQTHTNKLFLLASGARSLVSEVGG